MTLLVIFATLLLIVAAHQLFRVIELSRKLRQTKEWQVSDADNNLMGRFLLLFLVLFLGFFAWQVNRWMGRSLPPAASEHGEKVDLLWDANMYLITFIFVVTNCFLFWFAYKYRGNSKSRAEFYPHNNKLEMLWTVVPAIALSFIIIFGLKYWNEIMKLPKSDKRVVIELYAKQFDWTARYPGKDGRLGETDFRQISGSNAVGMDTNDLTGNDDILVKNEFHIPVGQEIELRMRSRDVIHSAYLPHFRAQMNCVPGMVTYFKFKPTKTTVQMRKDPYVIEMMKNINKQRETDHKEPVAFDYILLCNKICGASHYNMQMNLIVDNEADYKAWLQKQKPFKIVAQK